MLLGAHQLQIFVSVVLILGAAAAALICDFLKRKNDELLELTIELTIRHEEELKHLQQKKTRVSELAPKIEQVAVAAGVPKKAARKENKRAANSSALAAMERGASLAGSGKRPGSADAAPEQPPEVASAAGVKKDWESLLNRNVQAARIAKPAIFTLVGEEPQAAEPALPAGFQDGFVLSKLVQSRQPISGLVVSIGVSASRKPDGALPESVGKLVQSLLGPCDFAAQSSEDEFLVICPQERGASAQRRLGQIAQQLWDFQLLSLGSFQLLFSWGGVEVRSESIEEAIASASERMKETKRGRKLLRRAV
jgi:hypothetical protein